MHIILVSDRMATARSITLTGAHLALIGAALCTCIVALASLFSYLTVRHAAESRLPILQELVRDISLEETSKTRELVRENLANMAMRLGEMQAQMMQLDSLGERLAALVGVKPPEKKPPQAVMAPSGGPLTRPPEHLNPLALQRALDDLSRQIEMRSETLSALENRILEERIRKHMLPTALPTPDGVPASSGFGWRRDPFTGQTAMHEGIDFIAETGTPILAAAAGVVVTAEFHPQYGHMVEIDHGNDLITRYAHAAEIFVKPGQFVKRGQRIASVGSTGRSTGPHLHFEVRIAGAAVNPMHFLERGNNRLARR